MLPKASDPELPKTTCSDCWLSTLKVCEQAWRALIVPSLGGIGGSALELALELDRELGALELSGGGGCAAPAAPTAPTAPIAPIAPAAAAADAADDAAADAAAASMHAARRSASGVRRRDKSSPDEGRN